MFFTLHDNSYIAIIGDIKDSKKLENRKVIQERLSEVLNQINNKYINAISSKFMITLGDEFQGLLCNGRDTIHIISEIKRVMHPVKIRFGVGIGSISTEIYKDIPLGADGPAYYKAREAIEYLKQKEKRNQTEAADIRLEMDGGENLAAVTMVNTILMLLTVIEDSWSERQREIISDMLIHQDSQAESAKRLNIKQPTIQKTLAKGNYYAYKQALDTIGNILQEIKREDV